jgi:hypothetical protein
VQAEKMGDKLNIAHWHSNLGVVYAYLEQREPARAHYAEARRIYAELGNQQMVEQVNTNEELTLGD